MTVKGGWDAGVAAIFPLVFPRRAGYAHPQMPAPHSLPSYRIACDSLVALPPATADGSVWLAKNSDRPAHECQPLVQVPRQSHSAGSRLRCTYIDIPQVVETARVIGSQPFWLWGFEHGLNEYGVAIGNHTVFAKDPLTGKGLVGMDLVRLGLERGRTAEQAIEVMTQLIERHGQGGSGYFDTEWPYHNSFLVADGATAFVLETSDRHWALRRVPDVGSVSNHLTIGSDWDALSDGAIEHALSERWWSEEREERFDFAAAYRDNDSVPAVVSSARHRRTCALLEHGRGRIGLDALKHALRDHYGQAVPGRSMTPADAEYFSVCMHAEPVGTTTASMIARISVIAGEAPVYWASLGSPCIGAFIPLFVDADVPQILGTGGEHPADDSPWWQLKTLLTHVEQDWTDRAPRARAQLDEFEAEIAAQMRQQNLAAASPIDKAAFTRHAVDELLARVARLNRAWA
jgi:secernin